MRQTIKQGAEVDFLTPDEFVRLQPRPAQTTRIRGEAQVQLNAAGGGQVEVYKVPVGYSFEVRRIFLNIGGATAPGTGNVALNVANVFVAYLRSGNLIEYANPQSPMGIASVPGGQSWGEEQGPYLRNAEVFEVAAQGLTANAMLTVYLEGILLRPGQHESEGEHPGA